MTGSKKEAKIVRKSDIIDSISKSVKEDISKKAISEVLDLVLSSIKNAVAQSEKVNLAGFGIFEPRERKASTGRNPRTGEEVKIPAAKKVGFRPGKEFKDLLNK